MEWSYLDLIFFLIRPLEQFLRVELFELNKIFLTLIFYKIFNTNISLNKFTYKFLFLSFMI